MSTPSVSLAALCMDQNKAKTRAFGRCSVIVLTQSLRALQRGDLAQFDALVGDTSCQIRALKVAILYDRVAKDVQAQQHIHNLLERCASAQEALHGVPHRLDLYTFCDEHKLYMVQDLFFAVLSRLLTITNADGVHTKPLLLRTVEPTLSKDCCTVITDKAKLLLSKLSVDYVNMLARAESPFYREVCADVRVINNNGHLMAPFFHVMKVLFAHGAKERIPIVVKLFLKEKTICCTDLSPFLGIESRPALIVEGWTSEDPEESVEQTVQRVVQGIAAQGGIEEVVLMNAAIHPQYAACAKKALPGDIYNAEGELMAQRPYARRAQQEIAAYTERARAVGCCRENRALFLVRHIYTARVSKLGF